MRAGAAVVLALAACADAPAPAPPVPGRAAAAAAACDRAVAAHVGKPPDAVATVWRAATASGGALFETRDGDRVHTCAVSASGRVLELQHLR